MKVKDLKKIIDERLKSNPYYEDNSVEILLSTPGIGSRPSSEVTSAKFGFDWDQGKLLLDTETDLVPKHNNQTVFDEARDLLAYIDTKPTKRPGYEQRRAQAIFKRLGEDIMQYQSIFHRTDLEE